MALSWHLETLRAQMRYILAFSWISCDYGIKLFRQLSAYLCKASNAIANRFIGPIKESLSWNL